MREDRHFDQPLLTRRKVMLGLAFASAAGIAAARQPNVRLDYLGDHKLDAILPEQIGGWKFVTSSGLVVAPEDQLAQAVYSQLLTRVYSDGENAPVMLLVAQSALQTGILQIHRPEICYTAGGYKLSPVEPHRITLPTGALDTLSLSAADGTRTEQVVYWTRIGDHMPRNWREQKIAVAAENFRRVIPDAVMVRVSTYGTDKAAALSTLDRFIRAMMDSVPPPLRRVFIS